MDATHRFVTDTEKNTWSGKAEGNHNHDSVYQAKGNYAASSHTHLAADIEESTTRKFMTTDEKNILSSLGTNAILLENQNLGQNGYLKLSNGLLIQWGKKRVDLTLEQYISPLHSMTLIILCI